MYETRRTREFQLRLKTTACERRDCSPKRCSSMSNISSYSLSTAESLLRVHAGHSHHLLTIRDAYFEQQLGFMHGYAAPGQPKPNQDAVLAHMIRLASVHDQTVNKGQLQSWGAITSHEWSQPPPRKYCDTPLPMA